MPPTSLDPLPVPSVTEYTAESIARILAALEDIASTTDTDCLYNDTAFLLRGIAQRALNPGGRAQA